MKIVIVEDERHNSRMLKGMVEAIRPEWDTVAILDTVQDSIKWFQDNPAPDLVLMDIQLLDGICFSIFDKVDIESKVIFTTAYDEYAIQAFKVDSVDYLLKPIKESDLIRAFSKFEKLYKSDISLKKEFDYNSIIEAIRDGKRQYRSRFLITGVSSYVTIPVNDIALFYSENKITSLVTKRGKEYTIDFTLEQLESELDPKEFFRTNRQTFIHIDSVKRINNESGGKLRVTTSVSINTDIVVSRLKATEFKHWLGK